MKTCIFIPAAAMLLSACSGGDSTADVPPLPEQSAENANALMSEAERAAGNAAARAATTPPASRSTSETANEVTP